MAATETLRAALCRAEEAILDVAKLIDPTGPGDRQAAEDIEAAGYVVRKWREVLEAGDWPGPQPKSLPDTTFNCSTKRKCGEMGSCAEARFYLEECGLTRLDGDGDGMPCESLCR
jgi:hypothetical protein